MTAPLLQFTRLNHRLDAHFALDIDELHLAAGEVFCLLGPTGAGKSTLLKLLSGLVRPDAGTIHLRDTALEGPKTPLDVRREVTQVFQRPLLLRGSVRHNVEYGLRLRGQLARERVDWALEQLRLSDLADRSADRLSGGEAQLVALARALVLAPRLLLLDEPTASLDPARVALVEQVVLEAQRRDNSTVVWATHNLFQARRVAQRVGLLLDGRLVEVGPTDEFFERPREARTAAFVRGEYVC